MKKKGDCLGIKQFEKQPGESKVRKKKQIKLHI